MENLQELTVAELFEVFDQFVGERPYLSEAEADSDSLESLFAQFDSLVEQRPYLNQ